MFFFEVGGSAYCRNGVPGLTGEVAINIRIGMDKSISDRKHIVTPFAPW